jgi:hypothetical protein
MTYKVLSPFNTATQRFRVGAAVSASDDLHPHTIDSLLAAKLIGKDEPVRKPALKADHS